LVHDLMTLRLLFFVISNVKFTRKNQLPRISVWLESRIASKITTDETTFAMLNFTG
jgi:hypothetical protein